tara:strand:+ start:5627 stop:10036 length:4410 start_codon:yes stop_codon:yes gene_type:complete
MPKHNDEQIYGLDRNVTFKDRLFGSDGNNNKKSSNFRVGDIAQLILNTFGEAYSNVIITGGVTWISGFVYEVSELNFFINSVYYTTASTQVTLNDADATNPRIDLITVNDLLEINIIEGTPSPNPVKPEIPENTLEISFVFVESGATQPGEITENIAYNENLGNPTEWDATQVNTTAFNFNNTTNPYRDNNSILFSNITNEIDREISLTSIENLETENYDTLHFYIKLNDVLLQTDIIQIYLKDNQGLKTNYIRLGNGSYGFNINNTSSYQSIIIPFSAFTLLPQQFNSFNLAISNSLESSFQIDYVRFIGGINIEKTFNTFLSLLDTPSSYLKKANYSPLVNLAENSLVLKRIPLFDDLYNSNSIINGGIIFERELIYTVWATAYIVNSVVYFDQPISQEVTLDPADATNPRIDIFAIFNDGNGNRGANVIKGVPNINPAKPNLENENQVEVSFKLLQANETAPPEINNTIIYNENLGAPLEWDNATIPTIANPSYSVNPYTGSKSYSLGISELYTFMDFVGETPITYNTNDFLIFAIKTDSNWSSEDTIDIRIGNSSLRIKSLSITINTQTASSYNLNLSLRDWQYAYVPIGQFNFTESDFDVIAYQYKLNAEVYFDNIFVQSGNTNPITNPTQAVWGNITGNITEQIDLIEYINDNLGTQNISTDPNNIATIGTDGGLFVPPGIPNSGSASLRYIFLSATNPQEPTPNTLQINNVNPALATEIYFSTTAYPNRSISNILELLEQGDALYMQQSNNDDIFINANITGEAIDNGTFFTVPIQIVSSGLAFTPNSFTDLIVYHANSGGVGGISQTMIVETVTISNLSSSDVTSSNAIAIKSNGGLLSDILIGTDVNGVDSGFGVSITLKYPDSAIVSKTYKYAGFFSGVGSLYKPINNNQSPILVPTQGDEVQIQLTAIEKESAAYKSVINVVDWADPAPLASVGDRYLIPSTAGTKDASWLTFETVKNAIYEATDFNGSIWFLRVSQTQSIGDRVYVIQNDKDWYVSGSGNWVVREVDGDFVDTAVSKIGTNIDFTEDALYNEVNFLTSGDLTLNMTGAVKGTYTQVYCNGYSPNITGQDFFISSGLLDPNSLNILSFYYDGTRIYLNIGNVQNLTTPQITSISQGDESLIVNWGSVPNSDNYVLERSTDNFATAGNVVYSGSLLQFENTSLVNGTEYFFRVKAQGVGFIESAFSLVQSETPSKFSWATRTPAYGISITDKLDSTATYAFTVVPNIDGTGTETQIGFSGEKVDTAQILAIPDSDLYIKSFKAQGTLAGIDIPRISGNCIQVKSGGNLVTDPTSGVFAGLATTGRYNTASGALTFFQSNNPLTAISTSAAITSGELYYTGSGTTAAFRMEHNLADTDIGRIHNTDIEGSSINASNDFRILAIRKTNTELFGYENNLLGGQNIAYTDEGRANNQINFMTANGGLRPLGGYLGSILFYNNDIGTTELFKIRDYFNSVYSIY